MTPELQSFLDGAQGYILTAFAVFLRIGAAAFFLPGIGERNIPAYVKLGGAMALAVIVTPLVVSDIAFDTRRIDLLLPIFVSEALCGLLIGLSVRFMIFALQTGGALVAQNLSIAQMFGSGVAATPEPTIATLLTMGGIALALSMGLHVKLAVMLADSYTILPFGLKPSGEDAAAWSAERASDAFMLAVSISLPFVVVSFLYNMSLGAMNKAMPQLMVAFIGVPFITGAGLLLLMMATPTILTMWAGRLDRVLLSPLGLDP